LVNITYKLGLGKRGTEILQSIRWAKHRRAYQSTPNSEGRIVPAKNKKLAGIVIDESGLASLARENSELLIANKSKNESVVIISQL